MQKFCKLPYQPHYLKEESLVSTLNRKTMRKSQFSPSQITEILKEFDNGKSVVDLTLAHGVGSPTFYKWHSKHAGMNPK